MDRVIEKKQGISRAFTMKAIPYWLGAFVLLFVVYLLAYSSALWKAEWWSRFS